MVRLTLGYFLARGLGAAMQLASLALLTRLLSRSAYGEYAYGVAWAVMLTGFAFQWVSVSVLRFAASPKVHLGNLTKTVSWIAGAIGLGVAGVLAITVAARLVPLDLLPLVSVVAVLICTLGVFDITCQFAIATRNPVAFLRLTVGKAALALCIGAALAYAGYGGIAVLWASVVALLVSCVAFWGARWRQLSAGGMSCELAANLARFGVPSGAIMGLASLAATADRVVVGWLLGADAVGVYASACELASQGVTVLMVTVNYAALPVAIRSVDQGRLDAAREQLAKSSEVLLGIGMPAAAAMWALSDEISGLLLGESFRAPVAMLIGPVAVAALVVGLRAYYFDLAFQLTRRTDVQLGVSAAGAMISVAASVAWVGAIGLAGAPAAMATSGVCGLLASAWIGRRYFALRVPIRAWGKILIATAAIYVLLNLTAPLQGLSGLTLRVALAGLVYGLLMSLFDVAGLRQWLARLFGIPR